MARSRKDDAGGRATEFERRLSEARKRPGVQELMDLHERYYQAQQVIHAAEAAGRQVIITSSSSTAESHA